MNSRRLIDGPRAEDKTSSRAKTNTLEGVEREDSYVRFGSKADICSAKRHVRFTPNSDIDCAFRMSTKGQKRTPGQFELALLFDDLVSEAE